MTLYHLDPTARKLTEIYSFRPEGKEKVTRTIAVRMLQGSPYIFWEEASGEASKLYIRRVDLPAGARRPAGAVQQKPTEKKEEATTP